MKNSALRFAALLIFGRLVLSASPAAAALAVTATGSYSVTIAAANLTTPSTAGTDLTATYTSAANAVVMTANGGTNGAAWHITVKGTFTTWNSNLTLSVLRTGANTGGAGTISGGTSFVAVGTTAVTFFSGTRGTANQTGIPVEIQVGGVSLAVPPAAYSATLTYTITSP